MFSLDYLRLEKVSLIECMNALIGAGAFRVVT